ncbi:DUF397 domain-containing protein [Streptomyces capitiformicae]|uniref:DUF397 domain-containing protein n=1 Tax=Streptomyces capitiformicae TaxID=2014920 RepID=A0A919DES3_9ACTN|nr:DUF397 domain-containing protein [Streptomyces capitiformicae]GHE38816.1 hypothetical protein GCM10017771_57620 [Streptomyces capitiformicae]
MTDVIGPFRKSSYSGTQSNCVEVAPTTGGRAIRDSKNPHGPLLHLGPDGWRAFLGGVKNGAFS